jgi:hypothetical protein
MEEIKQKSLFPRRLWKCWSSRTRGSWEEGQRQRRASLVPLPSPHKAGTARHYLKMNELDPNKERQVKRKMKRTGHLHQTGQIGMKGLDINNRQAK